MESEILIYFFFKQSTGVLSVLKRHFSCPFKQKCNFKMHVVMQFYARERQPKKKRKLK